MRSAAQRTWNDLPPMRHETPKTASFVSVLFWGCCTSDHRGTPWPRTACTPAQRRGTEGAEVIMFSVHSNISPLCVLWTKGDVNRKSDSNALDAQRKSVQRVRWIVRARVPKVTRAGQNPRIRVERIRFIPTTEERYCSNVRLALAMPRCVSNWPPEGVCLNIFQSFLLDKLSSKDVMSSRTHRANFLVENTCPLTSAADPVLLP